MLIRIGRNLAVVAGTLVVVVIGGLVYSEHENSREVSVPAADELRWRFDRAAAWVLNNRTRLLDENNPMLWLWVREAGRRSGNSRLQNLAADYQSRHTDTTPWRFIFDPYKGGRRLLMGFPGWLPDYNRLFLYGATCDDMAREDPGVVALLSPSACDAHWLWLRSPWCRTHQLMGLRFVRKNRCEPAAETESTIKSVQELILGELRWDFRVEDAYIQKVLMLVESGQRGQVKEIWLRRVLDAQRTDGGWDGVDVIARLPGHRVLCWSDGRLYPRIQPQSASTFHATAQGLYLLALLLAPGD
jgi:hypothetical protein